jgi:LysM repeat protein
VRFVYRLIASLLVLAILPLGIVQARPHREVTAFDLIIAMNTLRISLGNQALIEDPIINAVAQATAEIMAANQMSWHMGDVSGRIQAAGFGGGAKVWATENFAVGSNHSIDTIMQVWADDSHMIPARNPAYCAIGAGVAKAPNGMTYYVLQAAYTSGMVCGEYKPSPGTNQPPGAPGRTPGVSQLIVPVQIATPGADGKTFHEVKPGQSLWAIAVAYKITIKDLETWNNLSKDSKLQIGQKLFIPGPDTAGYATPTPVGMIQAATPDTEGRIIHVVQPYNTLLAIASAYKVDMNALLQLNGLNAETPLQIGQKLLIRGPLASPTATQPPLKPLQRLTPADDGRYYHIVRSGETLSWIAGQYEVSIADLMAWNGLTAETILQVDARLLLQVTPPATSTATPAPPTVTPSATIPSRSATPSRTPTSPPPSATPTPARAVEGLPPVGYGILAAVLAGLGLLIWGRRKR